MGVDMIRKIYDRTGYVIDTHTAVAAYVCEDYKTRTKDETKCVIASTASPYKFVKSVMQAIGQADGEEDELKLLGNLEKVSKVEMPKAICDILDAEVLHTRECDADKMEEEVKKILGL